MVTETSPAWKSMSTARRIIIDHDEMDDVGDQIYQATTFDLDETDNGYVVSLKDGDDVIATPIRFENIDDDDALQTAVNQALGVFGYEIVDPYAEHVQLSHIDEWDFDTVAKKIGELPVAVDDAAAVEDAKWSMDLMARDAYAMPTVVASMRSDERIDAIAVEPDHRGVTVTTYRHDMSLPRLLADGTVIGFEQPWNEFRSIEDSELAERIRDGDIQAAERILAEAGAEGEFTDYHRALVEEEGTGMDPWPTEPAVIDNDVWANIPSVDTASMSGPSLS